MTYARQGIVVAARVGFQFASLRVRAGERVSRVVWWVALGVPVLVGCTGTIEDARVAGSGDDDGSSSGAPDIGVPNDPGSGRCDAIRDIFINNDCTSCHNATPQVSGGGLDLLSPGVSTRLVNQPSQNSRCRGEMLVNSARVEASVLLQAVAPSRFGGGNSCAPSVMPLGVDENAELALPDPEVDCIESWAKGLADAVTPPDVRVAPFDPASPTSAIAKAKYILRGAAVTDEELALVSGEEGALDSERLRTLIDRWMFDHRGRPTPTFEAKMRDFLRLTLQQKPVPIRAKDRYRFQLEIGGDNSPVDREQLIATIPEVFVRTAWDIVGGKEDFRRVVTTRRWYVTTAILAALHFTERSDFPAPGNGRLRTNKSFADFDGLQVGDYQDWRYVRFGQATDRTSATHVYPNIEDGNEIWDQKSWKDFATDLRNIRSEETIDVVAPRVGFFNTLEFLDNWPSNTDNQFRVTANQAVIAALDLTFEGGDSTEQPSLTGLDRDHSQETTPCFGCHRLLDPMRLEFQRFYTYDRYMAQADPADSSDASFAFHGHIESPIGSMDGFARLLVNHPRFADAWVQKLCMWANSARCDPTDDEFVRISAVFASGYDDSEDDDFRLHILIREFFSSPLFTGTRLSQTHKSNVFTVSTTRFVHLCHSLDERIKQVREERCDDGDDTCGAVEPLCPQEEKEVEESVLSSIGLSDYSRGSTTISTPSTTDAFLARSIQSTCQAITERVLEHFSSGDHRSSIERLVRMLMGLPRSHPRYERARDQLLRTYRILREPESCGVRDAFEANEDVPVDGDYVCGLDRSADDAMDAVFNIVCASSDLMGMGL